MKQRKNDLLLVAVLLIASAVLWLLFARPGDVGGWAVVTVDGEEIGRYALHEEREITIGDEDYNILTIRDGKAAVTEANCGDHTCVRTGEVSRTGESIVCLPHKVVVRIEGAVEQGPDAVVG